MGSKNKRVFDKKKGGVRRGCNEGTSSQLLILKNMEPKFEQPKQYTQEEISELEKSRTISDAELLKGVAEYVVDEKGEKRLNITDPQLEEIKLERKTRNSFTTDTEMGKFDLIMEKIKHLELHKDSPVSLTFDYSKGEPNVDVEILRDSSRARYGGFNEEGILIHVYAMDERLASSGLYLRDRESSSVYKSYPIPWKSIKDIKLR